MVAQKTLLKNIQWQMKHVDAAWSENHQFKCVALIQSQNGET